MNEQPTARGPADSLTPRAHIADCLCDTTLVLDGFLKNRRHLVLIGNKKVWLTNLAFRTMLKLAIAAKSKPHGWLDAQSIGNRGDQHQVICRLRRDLMKAGVAAKTLVENSGTSDYRLAVHPDNISYDPERISQLVLYACLIFQEFPKTAA